jgi:hypothetical protein
MMRSSQSAEPASMTISGADPDQLSLVDSSLPIVNSMTRTVGLLVRVVLTS